MATCDVCGHTENMPYNCRYCGGTFCSSHRLPENHRCPGLKDWNDPTGVFDSGFDDTVRFEGGRSGGPSVIDRFNRVTGTGGPLAYFRGNLSYLFLAVIWIVFVLQIIVLVVSPSLHRDIFILSTQHPLYLWTWVTSVFAHSPVNLSHIVVNSIVLYFFGPLVERRVSSKAFLTLFLLSGMAAGLAQIGTGIVLGESSGVLGASGAIMAIMGVLTVLNPNLRVYLFFVLPMPLWLLTTGFALYSVFFAIGGGIGAGQVAHLAHLVGLVIGLGYGEKLRREGQHLPSQLRLGPGGGFGGSGRRRF